MGNTLAIVNINITKKELGVEEHSYEDTTDTDKLVGEKASLKVILEKTKWNEKDLIIQIVSKRDSPLYNGYQLNENKEYTVDVSMKEKQEDSFIFITNNKTNEIKKYAFNGFKEYDMNDGCFTLVDSVKSTAGKDSDETSK